MNSEILSRLWQAGIDPQLRVASWVALGLAVLALLSFVVYAAFVT